MPRTGAARSTDAARTSRPGRRTLVIACGALAREVLAVIEVNRLDHITLRCIPASIHHTPKRIPDAVRGAIARGRRDGFEHILIGFGDCGTGGELDTVLAGENVERIGGPHCYAFFSGLEAFGDGLDDMTSFFLTDFSVRQFDAFIVKPLGLDRHPELREMYFGNYEKAVFLAQTDDPGLDTLARAAADRLGLAYERRLTGYGDLASFIEGDRRVRAARAPEIAL